MRLDDRRPDAEGHRASRFPQTEPGLIRLAASRDSSPASHQALETLCANYWFPIYAFARHMGHNAEDSQDLTQGFFLRLLEKNFLRQFEIERGHFRTFLLAAFRHYAANEHHRAQTRKHGGFPQTLTISFDGAEPRYHQELTDHQTPEQIYNRRWALALLDRVLSRLSLECRAGRSPWFHRLRSFLTAKPAFGAYTHIAAELHTTEGAVRQAVHRLRRKFRQLLQIEVAHTLADPAQTQAEIRFLIASIRRRP